MEGRRAADGPKVRSRGKVLSDPGGGSGLRESGEAECLMVTPGVEGGRCRSQDDGSRWSGVHLRLEVEPQVPHTQEEVAPSRSEV